MQKLVNKFLVIGVLGLVAVGVFGCNEDYEKAQQGKQVIIEKSGGTKPQWYLDGFQKSAGNTEYEIGFVERAKTQRSTAQTLAYQDALARLANRIETLIINEFSGGTEVSEQNRDLRENLSREFANAGIARGFISDVKINATYWEKARLEHEAEADYYWNYAVLIECPKNKIKEYEDKLREKASAYVKTQAQRNAENTRDATMADYDEYLKQGR